MTSYSGAVSGLKNVAMPWSLSNSDQPGMALVVTPLFGNNFVSWSLAIKDALEAKDKHGFIDGTIKEPVEEANLKKWKPVDSMVKSWVRNSISKEIVETFMFCKPARELRKEIEERYRAKIRSRHKVSSVPHGLKSSLREKEINMAFNGNQVEGSAMLAKGSFRNDNFKKVEDKKIDKMSKFCDHSQQNGHTREGANLVAETPIDCHKDKNYTEYANVMAAIQELAKIVKAKPEEQHVNFANLGEFAGKGGKIDYTPLTTLPG
ncbi:uncharacterized protein G2W53_033039 [Senna tora]|uniref:Retrotransposon Copia-like N-terminal domain-containing protein n=1 Tax=Senna tora TaxID=362788 RepID=A0A834SWY4_9FABA|nr:uncharacterized protein G2W53_033039 [Senna tora]